ncbi:MAG: intein-containing RctB family protein [Candidatus Omnitrophica bacterium]|nr:intein-containing RctB family protein [Candidatus Omnitrophota bacterium]MCM8793134.1 intein-containing RctB family protein [Candidatus Omnitrophota bacterium]
MGAPWNGPLEKIDDYRFRIPKSYKQGMQVEGIIYADEKMLQEIRQDQAPEQVANVAFLPGIVKYSLAMPDIHWGYGFCIGGVAATDPEKGGVISPGGVGYDVNCLCGNSFILNDLGYFLSIKNYKKIFPKENLSCVDFTKEKITSTKIRAFLIEKPLNKKIFRICTKTGKEIIATEDHPFYTKDGMKEVKRIRVNEAVALYPFEGIKYEEPSEEIIVDERRIKSLLLKLNKDSPGPGIQQIIKNLEKLNLLPIKFNSPSFPFFLKIFGYCLGNGLVYFNNKTGKGVTWFWGKEEDLEEIRKDIQKIGFTPSRIYKRQRKHKIKNPYKIYEFHDIENCFRVVSSSFAIVLVCLGMPLGNKAKQKYSLPKWIFKIPLWQKRLFLASFFGAEMSPPSTLTNHGTNFYCPIISLNKKIEALQSGLDFLRQISLLLKEFGIVTQKISQQEEVYDEKKDKNSYRIRLILSNESENLIKLYAKINFEYNRKRRFLANLAIQYLKEKKLFIKKREELALQVVALRQEGLNLQEVYQKIDLPQSNSRFIERSFYEGRKTSPRYFGEECLSFEDFVKIYSEGLGESGMVWDEVVSKEEIKYDGYVYDFMVAHPHHNFIANNFVVSNCGVRLVKTNLFIDEVKPKIKELTSALFHTIPAGVGSTGEIRISVQEERTLLVEGSRWAVSKGYGIKEDLESTEERGCMEGADPKDVSERAYERGKRQSGTLGSGNHFLEVQVIERIYDRTLAEKFGLREGQITIMIHSGSRGLGYQVCDDYLEIMGKAVRKYNISLPDRQLACAPIDSSEAQAYISAMRCAANYAWANRQCLMHLTRITFERVFNKSWEALGMFLIYDVAHNIAKFEKYIIDGKEKTLCVHRKGATRAFGPGHPELPEGYKETGQPVIIPGDMGRNSYLLVGTKKAEETFYSTCHGAGRVMSRAQAIKSSKGRNIARELEEIGIIVMSSGRETLAEEAPAAYKDVNEVVKVVQGAGISKIVCRMKPLGVIKG